MLILYRFAIKKTSYQLCPVASHIKFFSLPNWKSLRSIKNHSSDIYRAALATIYKMNNKTINEWLFKMFSFFLKIKTGLLINLHSHVVFDLCNVYKFRKSSSGFLYQWAFGFFTINIFGFLLNCCALKLFGGFSTNIYLFLLGTSIKMMNKFLWWNLYSKGISFIL